MPYINVVQNYSNRNLFEYNHKAIFSQVRKAMKHTGDRRDVALKNVLKTNYLKDIKAYEKMKMNFPYEKRRFMMGINSRARLEWEEALQRMAEPHQFFEQYVHIVTAMAMDIDKNFKSSFMLGFSKDEAKELVNSQLNVVSKRDKCIAILEVLNFSTIYGIVQTRWNRDNSLMGRDYATMSEDLRENARQSYILKEYVKEKLESKNFFWKLFNRKDVRAMQNYIRAAETSLAELHFPKEAEDEARAEFAQSYYSADECDFTIDTLERKFSSEENRVMMEQTYGKEAAVNNSFNILSSPDPKIIPEGKRLVDKSLLKVGFVPKLKTLERDMKLLQNIQNYLEDGKQIDGGASIRLNDGTVLDAVNVETLKIAVQNNMNKIQAIKELPEEERRAHIKSQLDDTYGFYTNEEEKDIQETLNKQDDPTQRANLESFMKTELEGRRYGAWSNMNARAMEEIAALHEENEIKEMGYTVPNLFLPAENPLRVNLNMDHLNENVNNREVAPRVVENARAVENDLLI